MSQEGCGEFREINIAEGLESWNPTLRKEREGSGTRPDEVTEKTNYTFIV